MTNDFKVSMENKFLFHIIVVMATKSLNEIKTGRKRKYVSTHKAVQWIAVSVLSTSISLESTGGQEKRLLDCCRQF